jgi:DNA polymerase delta subunit 1
MADEKVKTLYERDDMLTLADQKGDRVICQLIDGVGEDASFGNDKWARRYTVSLFGVTEEGTTIAIRAIEFCPYFYVRIHPSIDIGEEGAFARKFKRDVEQAMQNSGNGYLRNELKECRVVRKKDVYWFRNGQHQLYVKLTFTSKRCFRRVAELIAPQKWSKSKVPIKIMGTVKWKLYESNIDPLFRFYHHTDIHPAGWVCFAKKDVSDVPLMRRETVQQLEVQCNYRKVCPIEHHGVAPFLISCFDIECVGDDPYSFPDASRRSNAIIQIGVTTTRCGTDDPPLKWIICLGGAARDKNKGVAAVEGAEVVVVDNESDLICQWAEYIQELNPDIISGYNVFGFDYSYIWDRIELLQIKEDFGSMSRFAGRPARLQKKSLSSAAIGKAMFCYIAMEGRVICDVFEYMQQNYKYSTYKLDFVAEKNLGKKKEDMPYHEIFGHQQGATATPATRARIASYCVQDCYLCNQLIDKLRIITNIISMSNVTYTPMSQLFLRGQGVKVVSLFSKFAREEDWVIPVLPRNQPKVNYQGAIVLEANVGGYFDPVAVNDFSALYPSSIISHNLSHDTMVEIGGKYDNLPGQKYHDVKWVDKFGDHHYRFTTPEPIADEDMARVNVLEALAVRLKQPSPQKLV